jgi:8-oxo-dGTP diphosphatase
MAHVFQYTGPSLCVDALVERQLPDGRRAILLIERRFPPHGWAIPGGFVDAGESAETAVLRELAEETGLVGRILYQMHTYSDPQRDPRRQTASVAFAVAAEGEPIAGDDAGLARFWPLDALPPLAFDHGAIVGDYASGRFAPPAAIPPTARAL